MADKKCATCGAKVSSYQLMYDEKKKKTVPTCINKACIKPYLVTPATQKKD